MSHHTPVPRRFHLDRAASLVEYALLVALIAMICFAAIIFLGEETSDSISRTGQSIADAGT